MIFKTVYFITRICVDVFSLHVHISDILCLFVARNDKNLKATKTAITGDNSLFQTQFTKSAFMRKLGVCSEVYGT
jgi:hypothetical protein